MSETVAIKEHDRLFDLYDADGCLVGKANPGKKVMLADAFYVPERTCRAVLHRVEYQEGTVAHTCSECGEILVCFDFEQDPPKPIGYCPGCGARVIKEES